MLKKTPLKSKNNQLKKTPLKSNSKGLKVHSSLKKSGNLNIVTFTTKRTPLKKTTSLQNKGTELVKTTELKKQNEKSKAKWEEVRNQVLKRDNYKCVVCGKSATQVHHIHLRSKRRDLLYVKNNLVSLCNDCHCHQSTEGLREVNEKIAKAMYLSLNDLLDYASKIENNDILKFMITPRENHYMRIGYFDDGTLKGRFGSELFNFYWEDFEADDVMKIIPIVAKINKLKPRKVLLLNSTNIKTRLTDFFEKLLKEELNCKVETLEHDNVIPLWT